MDLFYWDDDNIRHKAGFWDVVDWWITNYPGDIFVVNPPEVVKIRELMIKLKEKKKP